MTVDAKRIWNESLEYQIRRANASLEEFANCVEDFEDEAKTFEQYAKEAPLAKHKGQSYASHAKRARQKLAGAEVQLEFYTTLVDTLEKLRR